MLGKLVLRIIRGDYGYIINNRICMVVEKQHSGYLKLLTSTGFEIRLINTIISI
jgi:hypothetical protein